MNSRPVKLLLPTGLGLVALLLAFLVVRPVNNTLAATLTVTNTNDSGPGSLRAAIALAVDGDTIDFDSSLNGQTITLTTGELAITKNLTIDGPGADQLSISGNNASRVFHITATVTISGVTIRDGHEFNSENGGGILNEAGTVNLFSTTIFSNTAYQGGGIYSIAGSVTIVNSTVSSNTARLDGGGVYNSGVPGNNDGTTVSHTTVSPSDGDIQNSGSDSAVNIINSTVSNNVAGGHGGGIVNFSNSTMTLTGSTVISNMANDKAGGLWNRSSLSLTDSTVSSNTATNNAGGIWNDGGTVDLTGSIVSSNATFTLDGGGIENDGGTVHLLNSTVSDNTASDDGGGIENEGSLTLTGSTVAGNTANDNGGGIFNDVGTVTLINSTVSGNMALDDGGGIYNTADNLNLFNSTIVDNTADSNNAGGDTGGGIYVLDGTATLTNSITANNRAFATANDCFRNAGVVSSAGYNLVQVPDASCVFAATGDITNTNPLLGPLADNGGDTLTHALLVGSLAIDKIPSGSNGCGTTIVADQRGITRPQGGACDIGAYEFDGTSSGIYMPIIFKSNGSF